MTINSFFTQQSMTGGVPLPTGQTGTKAVSGTPQGALAFFQMVLGGLPATLTPQSKVAPDKTPETTTLLTPQSKEPSVLQSDNPLLAKKPKLDLAQILATSEQVEDDSAQIIKIVAPSEDGGDIETVISLNQKAFDAIIKPLVTDKISAEQSIKETGSVSIYDLGLTPETIVMAADGFTTPKPGTEFSETPAQQILQNLRTLFEAGELNFENLSEDQAVRVHEILEKADTTVDGGASNVIVLELLQILAATPEGQVVALQPAKTDVATKGEALIHAKANAAPVGPEALNALTPGSDGETPDFEQILQKLGGNDNNKAKGNVEITNTKAATAKIDVGHNLPTLPSNFAFGTSAAAYGSGEAINTSYNTFGPTTGGVGTSSMQAMTSSITQSNHAGQSHPATQMVMITMQRAGLEGNNKSITLQLDPPELGRVDVKMVFDKNKSIRTVLTVEKPETMAMLQRDAHSLEKAMNDLGLNADGGVDLQLAPDGHDFGQDGGHDGSRNQTASGEAQNEDTELLIMPPSALYFDPATGQMRCDVLV